MTMRRWISGLVAAVVLAAAPAAFADANGAAKEIEKALAPKKIEGINTAVQAWRIGEQEILGDVDASIRVAKAFATFCTDPMISRYADAVDFSTEAAAKCLDAAGSKIADDDLAKRASLGQAMAKLGDALLMRGHGDKAEGLQDKALVHLEAAAAAENATTETLLALANIYGQFGRRQPPKAEEWLAKSIEIMEKVRDKAGGSAEFALQVGRLKVQLAEGREMEAKRNPKDRKLQKQVVETWEEALEAFATGLDGNKGDRTLASAYNDALWHVLRLTEGKSKREPVVLPHTVRYGWVKFDLPVSDAWNVKNASELEQEDMLFIAGKRDARAGQALTILVRQWTWGSNYKFIETGEVVGGDNIGGISKIAERDTRDYFQDIKDRVPLRKVRLSRRVPKAEAFTVKGLTKDGDPYEWRSYFFKSSDAKQTFQIIVIASLGYLDKYPFELESILESVEIVEKK